MSIRSMRRAFATAALVAATALAASADLAAQGAQGAPAGQGRGGGNAAPAQGGRGGGNAAGQGRGGGRGAAAAPAAPTPRWPDGKPIMGSVPGQPVGGWGAGVTTLPRGLSLDEIPFQPWARAVYDVRQIDQFEPHTRCKASGVSRQFSTPYGTEFVDVPDLQRMYIMDNGGPNSYRIVYLDGRSFPKEVPLTYYGYSIGRWDGDTLVVETRGLNEKFWLDTRGTPHTEQLKITERFTRTDMNTMRYVVTIDDPGAYTKPWTTGEFNLRWRAGDELFEYICQQFNLGTELMLGSQEDVDNTRFFVP